MGIPDAFANEQDIHVCTAERPLSYFVHLAGTYISESVAVPDSFAYRSNNYRPRDREIILSRVSVVLCGDTHGARIQLTSFATEMMNLMYRWPSVGNVGM